MKSTELRIGNYLYSPIGDALLMVDELSTEDIITKVVDRSKYPLPSGWRAEPIPLTEEWLLKFGFTKGFNDKVERYCLSNGNNIIIQYHNLGYLFIWEGSFIGKCIEYVHQLQNLYFAMAQEELTLKS